jgi:5'-nucleotidase
MSKPFILITNDDGIYAPGIQHLWQSMHEFADIIVVAPAMEQSAVGLSVTIRQPISIERIKWRDTQVEAWAVKGTPADCVKLALNAILHKKPDLILSGINKGNNAGRNILYSGTVGAIIEGVHQGIPGIAFSLDEDTDPCFANVESFIPQLTHYMLQHPLPSGTFLNVNFPKNDGEKIKGVRLTRQGKEYWKENLQKRNHPTEGNPYYWLGKQLAQFEEEDDSDIVWMRKGYAAAVPIHINELTHQGHLTEHQALFHEFVNR